MGQLTMHFQKNTRSDFFKYLGILLIYSILATTGCQQQAPLPASVGNSFEKLTALQSCYLTYCQQRNSAPRALGDLEPLLKQTPFDITEILTSPHAGSEIVVLWNALPDMQSATPLVIGYETSCFEEQRMVMTSQGVIMMSEHDFQAAKFPPGHRPPNLDIATDSK